MCQGVVFPNSVTYQLSASVSPEACAELADRLPLTAQLQFIGFGTVDVEINLLCDCNCDAPVSLLQHSHRLEWKEQTLAYDMTKISNTIM